MNRKERRRQRKTAGRNGLESMIARADALYRANRLPAALQLCRQMLAVETERADLHAFSGMIALRLGNHEEAVGFYGDAVRLRPDYAEAYCNLGNARRALGQTEAALTAYRRAAEIKPDMAQAHHNLGTLLLGSDRLEEAAAAYRRALELTPRSIETHRNLGIVQQRLGRLDEAVAAFRAALAIRPDWTVVYNNLLTALLEQGDARGAVAACDDWLAARPGNTEALAYKCVALNEAGERAALAHLLDFDRLVRITRFDPPDGFNAALAAHVLDHPTLKVPPKDDPTYHHDSLQITDELLVEPKGPVAALEEMMHRAVGEYIEALPADSDHPFHARRPNRWRLSSWGVVLNGQGNLMSHIHMDGYLSGVYYVRVPEAVTGSAAHAGWFELGRPIDELQTRAEPMVRPIRPEEGAMLLFPAYFYHRTVPFRSAEKRISIAFDVVIED